MNSRPASPTSSTTTPWKFDFYEAHLYGAWVFIVGFVVHVSLKLPTMWRSLQRYSLREIFTTPLARTRAEPGDGHGLVASQPVAADHLAGAESWGWWADRRPPCSC